MSAPRIIDAHTHVDEAGLWIDPPEAILERMDEAGIEKATIMTYRNAAMPYPRMIKRAVETIGPKRVIFASDGPGCDPRIEVEKVRMAGLTDDQEQLVFADNIQALLDRAGRQD